MLTIVYSALRSIANVEEVKHALQKELMVVPEIVTSGVGDFCDQASILLLKLIIFKLHLFEYSSISMAVYSAVLLKDLGHFKKNWNAICSDGWVPRF